MSAYTLCPTLRLDVMSHAVDCIFQMSNHTTRLEYATLPCVTSQLDREYFV